MLRVLENGNLLDQTPVDGDVVREYPDPSNLDLFTQYTYVTPTPQAPDMRVTKLAFKQRMTAQERIDVRAAAELDPIVFDFMDLVSDAQYIDLARSDTQAGVNYLEAQSHIAAGRASQILTDPIQEDERP